MTQNWESPYQPIDEDTLEREKRRAEERLVSADEGAARSTEAASLIRGFLGQISEMHVKNHYVEGLRPIFRGTHRAAS